MGSLESTAKWPRTLGVYADLVYSRGPDGLYADMAFGEYLAALAERVERVVVFGRLNAQRDGGEHRLGHDVAFVELPYYASVAELPAVYKSLPAARRRLAAVAGELDLLWVFGPHPVSLALLREARRRGVPTALGVRQDQPRYMRARLSGLRRLIGLPFFAYLEWSYRRRARRMPTVVAGDELAALYGGGPTVLSTAFTLVRDGSVVSEPQVRAAAEAKPFEIVSVGRLDPEKNPLLLVATAAQLRDAEPELDFRLRVVGDGPLAGALREEIDRLGLDAVVELCGYVPFGPELDAIYAASDLFLHISHTEGLPQVLIEAMAAGLPIVATAVGGVPALVEPAGVPLVEPGDAAAAAGAVSEMLQDDARRAELAWAGARRAAELTIEHQQAAVLEFFTATRERSER